MRRRQHSVVYYLWDGSEWRPVGGELDSSNWTFTFRDGTQHTFTSANIIFGVAEPRKPPAGEHLLWIYYP